MGCLIHGCDNDPRSRFTLKLGKICEEHWKKIPMWLRQEYWQATNYGNEEPSEELANKIREALNAHS